MKQEDQAKKMQQIIAKAWIDKAFKQHLLANPVGTMKGEGLEIPEDIEVQVVENTDKLFYLLLPPRPAPNELSDDELAAVAGGADIYLYWRTNLPKIG